MDDGRLTGNLQLLARVRHVYDDAASCIGELRNGLFVRIVPSPAAPLEVDDVVLIDDQNSTVEVVDAVLWEPAPAVGVVRAVHDDTVVLEVGLGLRTCPLNEVSCAVGDTVEFTDVAGILRVVVEEPILVLRGSDPARQRADELAPRPDTEEETLGFGDFAGAPAVLERARELVDVVIAQRSRFAELGARPIKGVLFSGDPGVGKTLLARIVAAESKAAFFTVNGPDFFGKYVGETEERLRAVFDAAARHDRSVVFFDEFDSVASSRSDEMHEVSRRVVSTLLTRLDGLDGDDGVVVIAATNRAEDLDPAVLRPGRFDWHLPFPPLDQPARREILDVSRRRLKTVDAVRLDEVAARTEGWSGAELVAIWREASVVAIGEEHSVITREDIERGVERVAAERATRTERTRSGSGAGR